MKSAFLGIDVGTSGTKVLLIDVTGRILGESTSEYALSSPKPMWSEQDPYDWWKAAVEGIVQVISTAGVTGNEIKGIGLTGQMHGLVLLDAQGEVLRPAILWNDQRTSEQCKIINECVGCDNVIEFTGNPVLTGFTAPKILWVKEHEPDIYAMIAHVLLPKDYIRYRLTNSFSTDVSDASGTALFDVGRRRWSAEMMNACKIPDNWMGEVTESVVVSGFVTREAGDITGLVVGTPVVGGAGDQAAGAVGNGIVEQGMTSVVIGTSGVVFTAMDNYQKDSLGRLHSFCHAVPGKWHLMGVMLSAGGSLQWYRDTFCKDEIGEAAEAGIDVYHLMMEEAASAVAGCEGLIFLPYLSGERTPYPDPRARGVWFGLTRRHSKAYMTRSIIEGITFGLNDSLRLMGEMGITGIDRVRVSGGGARSDLWKSILADVFDSAIVSVNVTQGAAFGAAILAAVGLGAFGSVEEACSAIVKEVEEIRPHNEGESIARYRENYKVYRALYPAVSKLF